MNDYLVLKAVDDVMLPTYLPNGEPEGAIGFDNGKTYHLRVIGNGFLDVSDYVLDELVIATRDLNQAVMFGSFTVVSDADENIVRGYN